MSRLRSDSAASSSQCHVAREKVGSSDEPPTNAEPLRRPSRCPRPDHGRGASNITHGGRFAMSLKCFSQLRAPDRVRLFPLRPLAGTSINRSWRSPSHLCCNNSPSRVLTRGRDIVTRPMTPVPRPSSAVAISSRSITAALSSGSGTVSFGQSATAFRPRPSSSEDADTS